MQAQLCDESTSERLIIALEPECAALFVREQRDEHPNPALLATHYAVVDCGGGTVDIAYHCVEKKKDGSMAIKELAPPSGGPYGGTLVDGALELLLDKIFGVGFCEKLKWRYGDVWMKLMSELEHAKSGLDGKKDDDKLYFELSMRFGEACETLVEKSATSLLKACTDPMVGYSHGKMTINAKLMKTWYDSAIEQICEGLNKNLQRRGAQMISAIYMVGTFSSSRYLLQGIRKGIHNIQKENIINPAESTVAIVHGAVIYGFNPSIVQERVSAMSYGVQIQEDFDPARHPIESRVYLAGTPRCMKVYSEFVKKDETLRSPDIRVQHYTAPTDTTTEVLVTIFCAPKAVKLIDDPECMQLATILVKMPDITGGKKRAITVSMIFGGPEIHVVAKDNTTGKAFDTVVDFDHKK